MCISGWLISPICHVALQISVLWRVAEDDFLLLASDGLWDVMTNGVRFRTSSNRGHNSGFCLSVSVLEENAGEKPPSHCHQVTKPPSHQVTDLKVPRQSWMGFTRPNNWKELLMRSGSGPRVLPAIGLSRKQLTSARTAYARPPA